MLRSFNFDLIVLRNLSKVTEVMECLLEFCQFKLAGMKFVVQEIQDELKIKNSIAFENLAGQLN